MLFSAKVTRVWTKILIIVMVCGIIDHLFNALGGVTGVMLYVSVGTLGKLGLPVWQNPLSGWGWPTPSMFGYLAGITVWLVVFYVLAAVHVKDREDHTKSSKKDDKE